MDDDSERERARQAERERRKSGGLTDEQVDQVRDAILASIYEDIGRSIVKKILWVCGACLAAFTAWLAVNGYIPLHK